jgi:hypothetical protein
MNMVGHDYGSVQIEVGSVSPGATLKDNCASMRRQDPGVVRREDNEEGDDAIRLDSSDTNITTRARYDSPLASLEIIVSKWERQQENLSLPRCRDARAYIYFAANSSFAA